MAYDPGAIDSTLAAAVGDEPGLIAELRLAFAQSAHAALASMREAEGAGEWSAAALRLEGLAASFGAVRLMGLATEAARGDASDPGALRRLGRAVARL